MSYSEDITEEYYYFSDKEQKLIEGFLEKRGYEIETNTVCGGHCGMYARNYYLQRIGGGWKTKKDRIDFEKLCKKNKISCSFSDYKKDGYSYIISADPSEEDIKLNL